MNRILTLVFLTFLFTIPAQAAPMARVVRIGDDATIVVHRDGRDATLRLAGIEITNAAAAQQLLRWTITGAWVMIEPVANDAVLLYRSPDAMFINREMVVRGYARATMPGIEPVSHVTITYLGESNPPDVTSEARTNSGRDRSRRSKASPSTPESRPRSRGASRRRGARRGY